MKNIFKLIQVLFLFLIIQQIAFADNIGITPGSGKTIATDTISGIDYQRFKMVIGPDGTNSGDLAFGQTTMSASLPVTIASDQGAFTCSLPTGAATSANQSTEITSLGTLAGGVTSSIYQENVAKINNVTPLMGNGVTGTGSQRVTIASDNTAFSVNSAIADGANVTLGAKADAKSTATDTTAITIMQVLKQISASVQAPPSQAVTNSGTFATQSTIADGGSTTLGSKADAKNTATDTTAITIMQVLKEISAMVQSPAALPANQSSNIAQINAVTPLMGNGATGTGSLRITLASDNTANSNPFLIKLQAPTSGGWSPYHLVSANSTNATVIKNSPGAVGGWYIYNHTSSMRKLAFHDASTTPTAGASIYFTINLPAGPTAANALGDAGLVFTTGIAFTTVTDVTDAGATAVGTSDLTINLFYK